MRVMFIYKGVVAVAGASLGGAASPVTCPVLESLTVTTPPPCLVIITAIILNKIK